MGRIYRIKPDSCILNILFILSHWTALSHSLSGILALSGYLAPSVLALIEACFGLEKK
jgi:hypothetical protein